MSRNASAAVGAGPARSNLNAKQQPIVIAVSIAVSIAAIFFLLSLPGLDTLPLDKHEALVLQAAKEMQQRGDLIVPWFNSEPRLNKPPLNYWATLAVAWVRGGGSSAEPSIIDARIPSLLAMLGCLILIPMLATRLSDGSTELGSGRLAAAMFAASPAIAFFAQDARPDPLYAFFCIAGLTCFMPPGGEKIGASANRYAPWLGWALFGLATLTKGPHIPLFLLLAWLLALTLVPIQAQDASGSALRRAIRSVRPVSGLAIFTLLTLPWWWLLKQQLGGDMLGQSQLGGALYQPDWHGVAQAYREVAGLLLLLLPWGFIPLIFWQRSLRLWREAPAFRRLALLSLVPVTLLLISPQHRWHYPLPVIPLFALLCATVLLDWRRTLSKDSQNRAIGLLGTVFAVVIAALASNSYFGWLQDPVRVDRVQQLSILAEPRYAGWPIVADVRIDSALQIAVAVADRPIEVLDGPEEIQSRLTRETASCLLLIMPESARQDLPASVSIVQLAQWDDREGRLAVVRVENDSSPGCAVESSRNDRTIDARRHDD